MGAAHWLTDHWFDLFQSVGITGGLLFTAYSIRKDERARRTGNSIAINDQYLRIWRELFLHPELGRVLRKDADLTKEPVSEREELFVHMLVLHLGTVYRAMKNREFVKLEGLEKDVREFFSLPIPRAVWRHILVMQDRSFVEFIESCLG